MGRLIDRFSMNKLFYSIAYILLLGIPAAVICFIIRDSLNFNAILLTTLATLIVGGGV